VLKRGMQSADPQPEIAALLDAAENHASLRIKAALKRMIPEYISSDVDAVV